MAVVRWPATCMLKPGSVFPGGSGGAHEPRPQPSCGPGARADRRAANAPASRSATLSPHEGSRRGRVAPGRGCILRQVRRRYVESRRPGAGQPRLDHPPVRPDRLDPDPTLPIPLGNGVTLPLPPGADACHHRARLPGADRAGVANGWGPLSVPRLLPAARDPVGRAVVTQGSGVQHDHGLRPARRAGDW